MKFRPLVIEIEWPETHTGYQTARHFIEIYQDIPKNANPSKNGSRKFSRFHCFFRMYI